MSLRSPFKSLNSKDAKATGFRHSSLALLTGSSLLAVAGVLVFLFALPQAVSAQEALRAQSESTVIGAQVQSPDSTAQAEGVSENATDAQTAGAAQQAENQNGSTNNSGGTFDFDTFVPVTGGNASDTNDSSTNNANNTQKNNTQQNKTNKSTASKTSKKSTTGTVSSNNSSTKGTSTPATSNSGTSASSDNNEYATERSKLKSAFSELTSQLSSLSNAVSNSYTMDPTHNSKTPCSSGTSRNVIATANNALSAASSFTSHCSSPKKFSDLASCYSEIANAYKYLSSAANLAKTYHEKLIACPNPKTHSSCFTDCVKSHRIQKRGSSGSMQYDMDHLVNAQSLVSRIREANIL